MLETLRDVKARYSGNREYWRHGRMAGFRDRGVIVWYRKYRPTPTCHSRWIPCGCTRGPGQAVKKEMSCLT